MHDGERMVHKTIKFVPGLYKIFDEILVNAADNKVRDPTMDTLRVDVDPVRTWVLAGGWVSSVHGWMERGAAGRGWGRIRCSWGHRGRWAGAMRRFMKLQCEVG